MANRLTKKAFQFQVLIKSHIRTDIGDALRKNPKKELDDATFKQLNKTRIIIKSR